MEYQDPKVIISRVIPGTGNSAIWHDSPWLAGVLTNVDLSADLSVPARTVVPAPIAGTIHLNPLSIESFGLKRADTS